LLGRLKVWRDNYGFFEPEGGGEDLFVHRTEFVDPPETDRWYHIDVVDNPRRPGSMMAANARCTAAPPDVQRKAEVDSAWRQRREALREKDGA
jgi:cold shock CspA family protein